MLCVLLVSIDILNGYAISHHILQVVLMPDAEVQALETELKSRESSEQPTFLLGKKFLDDSELSTIVHMSLLKVGKWITNIK